MVSFIIVADRVMSAETPLRNGTLSWINMTNSLGLREISCQQNEQRSHEATALKVEKTAGHRRGTGAWKPRKPQDPMKK